MSTPMRQIRARYAEAEAGNEDAARRLLPAERPYPLPDALAQV